MLNSGIYQITGPEGKVYVGQAQDFNDRFTYHRSDLKYNRHHCPPLQDAYNKHGKGAFSFEPLMCFELADLTDAEQFVIHALWDTGILYNVVRYVKQPMRGRKMSPEAIEKARLSHVGSKRSDETKERIRAKALGRKVSLETRAKMSQAGKLRAPAGDSTRAKISAALKGRIRSSEHSDAISKAKKGTKLSAERCAEISLSLLGNNRALGFKHSEETRAKVRAGLKQFHMKQKEKQNNG